MNSHFVTVFEIGSRPINWQPILLCVMVCIAAVAIVIWKVAVGRDNKILARWHHVLLRRVCRWAWALIVDIPTGYQRPPRLSAKGAFLQSKDGCRTLCPCRSVAIPMSSLRLAEFGFPIRTISSCPVSITRVLMAVRSEGDCGCAYPIAATVF